MKAKTKLSYTYNMENKKKMLKIAYFELESTHLIADGNSKVKKV